MKKIMMFLFVTCLMGGFAVNANAQDAKLDKKLNDYSSYVEKYKDASKKFLEASKNVTSNNDKGKTSSLQSNYDKAKELERDLEQNKSKLNDKQIKKFETTKKDFQKAVNEYLKATDKRKK